MINFWKMKPHGSKDVLVVRQLLAEEDAARVMMPRVVQFGNVYLWLGFCQERENGGISE